MDEGGASREELALLSLHDLLTSVSSGHDLRVVLQKVAQGVVDALGFDMAAVNYLDDDGFLDVLGIAGDPDAIETMAGRRVPMADYLEEFELADDWGSLKFVPHERLPPDVVSTWVPQVQPLDVPDAWHPMDALYAPLHGPDGELVGVLGVDLPRDGRRPSVLKRQVLEMYAVQAGLAIHLARTRERELRIIEELREMATYRDEVNLALTHELKNPLTAILGHTELLGEALAEHGGASASVKSVATAVQRMQDLIGNLLVLGRVQHEHPALPDAHVDLGELVHEAADLLAMQARQGGVRVETRADTPGPLVRGDRDELVMIVTNLMSNAIKFTPDGGEVSLTLDTDTNTNTGTETHSDGGAPGEVLLTCRDTGLGIPLADQATIFDAFTRSTSPEARAVAGSGLGLTITRRIVERHGGSIEIVSAAGEGATVLVRLPLAA